VSYTIWVKPSHNLGKSGRVVVTMPVNLIFDEDKPCYVDGIPGAKCEVTRSVKEGFIWNGLRTRLIVTEIF
jgi:hypothetical protein